MQNKQKRSYKPLPKKTFVSRVSKDNHVNIIKHFQPNVSYNKQHSNCDLPEVNCDVDIKEKLQKPTIKPFKPPIRKPKSCQEVSSQSQVRTSSVTNANSSSQSKNANVHLGSTFKSKSNVESSKSSSSASVQNVKKPKQFPTTKSKSFTTDDKDGKLREMSDQKRSFVSFSSSEIDEAYIKNLKKEISLNKTETNDYWQTKKLRLLYNNKLFNRKVEALREEIGILLNTQMEGKREKLAELQTEIAAFRRNDKFCVYNVRNEVSPEDAKQEKRDENPAIGVETCVEVFSENAGETTGTLDLVLKENNNEPPEICDCRKSNQEEGNVSAPVKGSGSPPVVPDAVEGTPRRRFKSCSKSHPNQEYINSKIFEAHTLIDRIKDTLYDIKNNTKAKPYEIPTKANIDKETTTEEQFISEVMYDVGASDSGTSIYGDDAEAFRPQTRRKDTLTLARARLALKHGQREMSDDEVEMEDAKLERMTSLEYVRFKLNTISEHTESDVSSSGSEQNEKKVNIVSSFCNTDSVIRRSQETQVQPEVKTSTTQILRRVHSSTTQTEKEQKTKTLSVENITAVEVTLPTLLPNKQLVVQVLPSINIGRTLVIQNIHQISIGPDGMTNINFKSSAGNVGYFEVSRDETDNSLLKVKKVVETIKSLHPDVEESCINYLDLGTEKDDTTDEDSEPSLVIKEQDTEMGSNETVINTPSVKEMVYKSFQLYDNPNMHDPGILSHDLDVTTIDSSVYRTFINPEGLPEIPSYADLKRKRESNREFFKQKISLISALPISKKSNAKIVDSQKDISETKEAIKTKPRTPQKDMNSKLWDIGLYCSKAIQCCPSFPSKNKGLEVGRLSNKTDSSSSYERISLTISYSTETSDSSNNPESKQIKARENVNEQNENELDAKHDATFRNSPGHRDLSPVQDETASSRSVPGAAKENVSSEKEPAREEQNTDVDKSYLTRPSADTVLHQFISGLTDTKSNDLVQLVPKVKKNKSREKANYSNKYNVLPLQIHGDCGSTARYARNSHLERGSNGRYKDEENLFCRNTYAKSGDIAMRRKLLTYLPRQYYTEHNLNTSTSDTVTLDETMSEGEVKCQCSASIGEVHRCRGAKPIKRGLRLEGRTFRGDAYGTVRERRTYFNNWITYYVNKKPVVNDSTSVSNSI